MLGGYGMPGFAGPQPQQIDPTKILAWLQLMQKTPGALKSIGSGLSGMLGGSAAAAPATLGPLAGMAPEAAAGMGSAAGMAAGAAAAPEAGSASSLLALFGLA